MRGNDEILGFDAGPDWVAFMGFVILKIVIKLVGDEMGWRLCIIL